MHYLFSSSIPAIDPTGNFKTDGNQYARHYCDVFDLMHGFVIINSKYADIIFNKFITMAMYQSAAKINQAAYFPGFGAIRLGGNAGRNPQTPTVGANFTSLENLMNGGIVNGKITQDSPFFFCQNSIEGCVIYAMNTYDEYDQRVNKDFYDIVDANCADPYGFDQNTTWANPDSNTGPYYVPPSSLV